MPPTELNRAAVYYLFQLCLYIEQAGRGVADPTLGSLVNGIYWTTIKRHPNLRRGIIYWTPQTGWILRPKWRKVFKEIYQSQIIDLGLQL